MEGLKLYIDSTRAEARGLLATMTRILSSITSFPKVQQTIDHATYNEAVVDIYSGLKERSAVLCGRLASCNRLGVTLRYMA